MTTATYWIDKLQLARHPEGGYYRETYRAALDVPTIHSPERYWLIVETGDDVLDYREAVAYYAGACLSVVQGGDHSLTSFPEFVPDIVEWACADPSRGTPR
jgi:predicted esterase YcpF (UPF0227 family)